MPVIELFKHMQMEMEKEENRIAEEKAKMYINYLSNVFSKPIYGKTSKKYLQAKREFEQLISLDNKGNQKAKVYEWDFEREQRLGKK